MKLLTLLLIAVGLAMDCFAVAVGTAFANQNEKMKKFTSVSLIFGLAHFIMPLLGWLIGNAFKKHIESFDHWVAFTLLLFIGVKMLIEAFKKNGNKSFLIDKFSVVILLSIATSIDALIVGMSLNLLDFHLLFSVIVISFFAFAISLIGFVVGKKLGCVCGNKAEILGGLILIFIGFKVLIEHLSL